MYFSFYLIEFPNKILKVFWNFGKIVNFFTILYPIDSIIRKWYIFL